MKHSPVTIHHLVKSEDLNHHETLYAGRTAEWFVEAGFIAAAALTRPENIVCLQIHGMTFFRPVHSGEICCFTSRVVLTGKSKLVTHVEMKASDQPVVDGFITFIHVDKDGHTCAHGIEVLPQNEDEKMLYDRARKLFE